MTFMNARVPARVNDAIIEILCDLYCNVLSQVNDGAFKSCRIDRIYELNAHELEIYFKPRVMQWSYAIYRKVKSPSCSNQSDLNAA